MYRSARTPKMEEAERERDRTVPEDAARFLRARIILDELRKEYRCGRIDAQQFRTLRGQALAGDIGGAVKGLAKLMRRTW